VASALRVVLHLTRSGGVRRVAEVCLLTRGADGWVRAVPAWTWDGSAGDAVAGPAAEELEGLLA
jgi:pilus assembly protein CpaF